MWKIHCLDCEFNGMISPINGYPHFCPGCGASFSNCEVDYLRMNGSPLEDIPRRVAAL